MQLMRRLCNAVDVQVVHDDVHTNVEPPKLGKGTLPTPTS